MDMSKTHPMIYYHFMHHHANSVKSEDKNPDESLPKTHRFRSKYDDLSLKDLIELLKVQIEKEKEDARGD